MAIVGVVLGYAQVGLFVYAILGLAVVSMLGLTIASEPTRTTTYMT